MIEGELGATSEAEPCRVGSGDSPENCYDLGVLAGLRFRRVPHVSPGIRPFVNVLLGPYWTGSGRDDQAFSSSHFTVQTGLGAEMRWANSIQGLRVSLDYRHVFARNGARNQIRLKGVRDRSAAIQAAALLTRPQSSMNIADLNASAIAAVPGSP